jgi:hypothetical protein
VAVILGAVAFIWGLGGRRRWRLNGGCSFFLFKAGPEFPIALFILVPLMSLVEDRGETDDQRQGDEEDDGIEVGAVGFHIGSSIPAGGKIDDNGDNDHQSHGNADKELANDLFAAKAVCLPIADEILFPLRQHGTNFVIFSRVKSDDLKLPQLLSQYLYQTRKLDLPGIGSFTLDADAVIPQESDRIGQMPAIGVRFRNVVVKTADDSLINFIKEHTGKMKSLAASDLDFYLTTGRQLLNIGKPFYLDGIGTLIKNQEEGCDFTPGEYMVARLDEPGHERRGRGHQSDAAAVGFDEPAREREAKGSSTKQGVLLVLIIIGLGVIGWGGYYLYKRNSFSEPVEKQAVVLPDTTVKSNSAPPGDTISKEEVKDTVKVGATGAAPPPVVPATAAAAPTPAAPTTAAATLSPPAGAILYRFVILATDNKHRALRRYNQLLGYQLNIKMYQKDSAWFKLYFPIAALPKDTAYIRDSLSDTYAAPRVIIER